MNDKTTKYFSLEPTIYAAHYDDSIVLLDTKNNKYLSVIGDAALYLNAILTHEFKYHENRYCISSSLDEYDEKHLNDWIVHFKQKGMIIETHQFLRKYRASFPLKSGGLIDYKWDLKPFWEPFKQTSKWKVVQAFFQLVRVHHSMKHSGIKGLLDVIKRNSSDALYDPSEREIDQLAAAVDAASLFYPKKIYCLAWSATFVLLALTKKWRCHLVVGIQTNPFYAHAWAECSGHVVNDNPMIAEVLSIILKEPQA